MSRKRNPRKCLICGSVTAAPNQICRNCPSIDLVAVPPEFLHQFIGLFHGEGSISIRKNKKAGDATYVSLAVTLRADDHAVLELCQHYFGGTIGIYERKPGDPRMPQGKWTLKKSRDIQILLQAIRDLSVLPAKKLRDVDIALEWCEWFFSHDYHNFDRTPGLQLMEKLRATRAYDPRL